MVEGTSIDCEVCDITGTCNHRWLRLSWLSVSLSAHAKRLLSYRIVRESEVSDILTECRLQRHCSSLAYCSPTCRRRQSRPRTATSDERRAISPTSSRVADLSPQGSRSTIIVSAAIFGNDVSTADEIKVRACACACVCVCVWTRSADAFPAARHSATIWRSRRLYMRINNLYDVERPRRCRGVAAAVTGTQ